MKRGGVIKLALGAVLVVTVGCAAPLAAQLDARSLFEEGNRLYRESDYEGALERYLAILDGDRANGALYYNLGNTYFKLGDLGHAILHYERALRLDPRDTDTRANLDLARTLIADEITPLPGFWLLRFVAWWTQLLPRGTLLPLVAVAYLGMMSAIVIRVLNRRRPGVERWGGRIAVGLAAVSFILAINLLVVELGAGRSTQAIILADEVSVQSAPSEDTSLQLFSIHEGTKVRVDQRSGDWAEVVLADGKVGWVKAEVFEVF